MAARGSVGHSTIHTPSTYVPKGSNTQITRSQVGRPAIIPPYPPTVTTITVTEAGGVAVY